MTPPKLNQQEILLTRSEKYDSKLIEILRTQNKTPYVFPILEISPFSSNKLKQNVSALSKSDIFIFISKNAVEISHEYIDLKESKIVAIGPTTRSCIEKLGLKVDLSPSKEFSSEGLLKDELLQNVENKCITIIRGKTGRNKLELELHDRGAKIQNLMVYQKIRTKHSNRKILEIKKKFKQNSFAYIVILSCEVFENFFSIMREHDVNMNKLPIFVIPSQRIANAIRSKISNARCIVTFDPRNQAILDALVKGN